MEVFNKSHFGITALGIILLLLSSWGEVIAQGSTYNASIYELVSSGKAIEMTGETDGDGAGAGMAGIGDINDDGYDDFIAGAWRNNFDTGKVYIILGRQNWSSFTLNHADLIITGDETDSNFGAPISELGDVDGDGSLDFSVTAVRADDVGQDSGKFYVFSSKDMDSWGISSAASDIALASFIGESAGDWAGHGSHGIGDVNNDGFDDFLVASENKVPGGKVYLVYGRPSTDWSLDVSLGLVNSSFTTSGANEYLGIDTGRLGDINNDGYDDFIIGSLPFINGTRHRLAYIFLGQEKAWEKNTPISEANVTITLGSAPSAFSATWLSGKVDVNNDGYDDVIIGSWTDSPLGKTYLLLGRPTNNWDSAMNANDADASFIGTSSHVATGYAVSGLHDINNDGYDEIITSEFTPLERSYENYVHVMLGRPTNEWELDMSLTEAYITISSGIDTGDTDNNEAFGNTVEDVGDVDGNGVPDFAINQWQSATGTIFLLLNSEEEPFSLTPPDDGETITSTTDDAAFNGLLVSLLSIMGISPLRRRFREE